MGAIASELADFVIVTSDNPRTEDPMAIIEQILPGIKKKKCSYHVEVSRVKAIHYALLHAKPDDVIVLAGKGHETYQEICGVKHHLDEREIVADYLNETRR
jgi:UDP-N-acetylmuramoyl-L-alanyl-D-glutamate--2,6-diaminopimelate ligase